MIRDEDHFEPACALRLGKGVCDSGEAGRPEGTMAGRQDFFRALSIGLKPLRKAPLGEVI